MIYPSISQYIESIKDAEDNFATLTNLRPVLGEDGNPVMTSGNFAVVFKMRDVETGKFYAVKCFLKDQPNRAESYRLITEELEDVTSTTTYLTKFKYVDKELFVDTSNSEEDEFPVLLMEWVEGVTLDKYIRQHIDDKYELRMLAYRFSRLAMWLMAQPFAHGDIKPDNIMVREDGSLTLIDYDGMYVPAMKGQKSRELGSPDFRHPSRTEDDFDEHVDDFSLVSMLVSMRVIANDPTLLERYGVADRLLFSEKDYCDIKSCKLLHEIFPSADNEINTLVSLFTIVLIQGNLSKVSFRLLTLNRLKEPEVLSTEVTEEDLANAWIDKYGVKYSRDKKRLLKAPEDIEEYEIKKGTKIICKGAACRCYHLKQITIPNSVTSIGSYAFYDCESLQQITIPNSVTTIGVSAFYRCESLQQITIPNSVTKIGAWLFYGCESLKQVAIPNSVTTIGNEVFGYCYSLQHITIPNSVTKIDDRSFFSCEFLQQITISDSVISIGDETFKRCTSLKQIIIPNSVANIGKGVFVECKGLISIKVDSRNKFFDSRNDCNAIIETKSNTLIAGCSLSIIPDSVTSIGDRAFDFCFSLHQIIIPDGVKGIGDEAFNGCESLQQITIPNSVTKIGDKVFYGCDSLQQITIPNSVTSIGDSVFFNCISLRQITIPNSVTSIGDRVFFNCNSLRQIMIPNSVTSIGEYAFQWCMSLQQITIPNSVTSIGYGAFECCLSLQQITISRKTYNLLKDNLQEYSDIILFSD